MPDKFEENKLNIAAAQSDMCKGYAWGSLGILTSGLIWLVSCFVSYNFSSDKAIWTLLIGGALISPVSSVWEKLAGLKGHSLDNPLKHLAMESTIWMIMCVFIAYGLSMQKTEWFFQAMMLIIGGRYLTFTTLFGKKIYWVLGSSLGISAFLLFRFQIQSFGSLLTGALTEIVFGLLMYLNYRKSIMKLNFDNVK